MAAHNGLNALLLGQVVCYRHCVIHLGVGRVNLVSLLIVLPQGFIDHLSECICGMLKLQPCEGQNGRLENSHPSPASMVSLLQYWVLGWLSRPKAPIPVSGLRFEVRGALGGWVAEPGIWV